MYQTYTQMVHFKEAHEMQLAITSYLPAKQVISDNSERYFSRQLVLVPILASTLLIQLLTYGLAKQWKTAQAIGPLNLHERTERSV